MTRTQRIAASFSRAAATYESAARAQDIAAARLAGLITQAVGGRDGGALRVLEIGCGTGLLTRRLLAALPGGTWLVTDIAPAMLDAARAAVSDPRPVWRVLDGERPGAELAQPHAFDLVASSLAAQWFDDLGQALAAQAALLAPGGLLALSLPGAGSFSEWSAAHAALGLSCGVPRLPAAQELVARFPAGGALTLTTETFAVRHASGLDFARSLKALGAALPRPDHAPLSPAQLRAVLASLSGPFDVTYAIHYALWRKEAP